jgi:hypothetical protein
MLLGTSIVFVGVLVFVFADPARHGSGYVLSTLGLVVIGAALLGTMWYGTLEEARGSQQPTPTFLPPTGPSV